MPPRRSRRLAPGGARLLAVLAPLALTVLAVAAGARPEVSSAAAQAAPDRSGTPTSAQDRWKQDCAVCHGLRGEGSFQGPRIDDRGTASVDFMVRTGRMPLAFRDGASMFGGDPPNDPTRRPTAYSDEQIRELVAYTAGFVTGPTVPPEPDLAGADVARGGELYRLNCAACHQMAGAGGALAYGNVAPPLHASSPVDVVEAMRTGPGSMPVFPASAVDPGQTRDIAAYVAYLNHPQDRGGAPLWHIGPVGEGLIAWLFGLGVIILLCRWLGQRDPVTTHG